MRDRGFGPTATGPLAGSSAVAGPLAGNSTEAALAEITAGAAARDAAREPQVPGRCLPGAAALWSVELQRGGRRDPASRGHRARARAAGRGRRRLGGPDLRRPPQRRRAARGAGPAGLRDRELAAVQAGSLLAGVWGGDPVGDEGQPATVTGAIAARGEDLLLGCRRVGSRGRAGTRRGRRAAPARVGRRSRPPQRRGRHGLVSGERAGGLGLASCGLPRRSGAWVARAARGRSPHSPGSDATRCAPRRAGRAWPTAPPRPHLQRWRSAPAAASSRALRPDASSPPCARSMHGSTAQRRRWPEDASDLGSVALHARAAIAAACRELLDEAARACGSRPFARAQALDRARRDLELFLLQHRLDPLLARAGTAALDELAEDGKSAGGRWIT